MEKIRVIILILISIFIFALTGCNSSSEKEVKALASEAKSSIVFKYKVEIIELFNNSLKVELNIEGDISIIDELDSNYFEVKNNYLTFKDNIKIDKEYYEVKTYFKNRDGNEGIILYKIKINQDNLNSKPLNNSEDNRVNLDSDGDNIPDNVEALLNMDSSNPDENGNGILDGLEGDTFFSKQWYIVANGEPMNPSGVPSIEGNDLGLLNIYSKYMGYNNGNPIVVQVVDSGIDSSHEDLKDNFILDYSLDGATQGEPTPAGVSEPHGTMIAGIIASRAFNGVGVRGVAPFAKIAGSNWLARQSLDGLEKAWLTGEGANEITVSNNSWGKYFVADTFYEDILEKGAKSLRDGKGRVYIFASGNAKEFGADANTQYLINNRFVVVVGAVDHRNMATSYSTSGANLWVVAYGGSKKTTEGPTVATTYLTNRSTQTWDEDLKRNYTYAMAGSSAAAPMVSGIVALMLEACPQLSYRDVKYILAKSAKKIDTQNELWVTNSSGLSFNREYGFGLVDATTAIYICQNGYIPLPQEEMAEAILSIKSEFQDREELSFNISKDLKVEWAEVVLDMDTKNASEFDIYLISPEGTKIKILASGTKIGEDFIPYPNWMKGGFRFSTGAMLDENSIGEWRVEIVNRGSSVAQINGAKLTIYGYDKDKR